MNESVPQLLWKLKEKYPYLRYTQIMSNAVLEWGSYKNLDLFFLDDEELRRALCKKLYPDADHTYPCSLGETL